MKELYEKNKLAFTLVWIGAYVVLFSLADKLSAAVGIEKMITAPLGIAFVLVMVIFLTKNKLKEEYGLCDFKGRYGDVLFFIPIIPIFVLYLWNGVAWNGTVYEALLGVVAMLCVGFVEEMLFRGFLFKTMCKDNIKVAVLVSSLTFGLGHIVNLLNGKDLLPTLLQMCYATSLGFLLTMIFYKGMSIIPCIILHSVLNIISIFNVPGTRIYRIISSSVLCVISLAYALWIWKKARHKKEQLHE